MNVLAEQPLSEITLRKYELPRNLKERELVKKLCLSMGLLQPGDSRDVVVDVLHVLLKGGKRRVLLNVSEMEQKVVRNRKLHRIPLAGSSAPNIRRQIKRLRKLLIVEKQKSGYRLSEFMSMEKLFSEKIEGFVITSISRRIKEYLKTADEVFSRKRSFSSKK